MPRFPISHRVHDRHRSTQGRQVVVAIAQPTLSAADLPAAVGHLRSSEAAMINAFTSAWSGFHCRRLRRYELAVPLNDLGILFGPAVVRDESPAVRSGTVDVRDVVCVRELAGGDDLPCEAPAVVVGGQRTHAPGHVRRRLGDPETGLFAAEPAPGLFGDPETFQHALRAQPARRHTDRSDTGVAQVTGEIADEPVNTGLYEVVVEPDAGAVAGVGLTGPVSHLDE